MKLLVTTTNAHKLIEINEIFTKLPLIVEVESLEKIMDVLEDGNTFLDNAKKKALEYAKIYQTITLSDDSGLCVDAIHQMPGVYSSRYSGLGDKINNQKLLNALSGENNRNATFYSVIAIAFPDGKVFSFEGKIHGSISEVEMGSEGFGYDSLFIPEGYNQTFASLGSDFKAKHSHRRMALNKVMEGFDEIINYWRYSWKA